MLLNPFTPKGPPQKPWWFIHVFGLSGGRDDTILYYFLYQFDTLWWRLSVTFWPFSLVLFFPTSWVTSPFLLVQTILIITPKIEVCKKQLHFGSRFQDFLLIFSQCSSIFSIFLWGCELWNILVATQDEWDTEVEKPQAAVNAHPRRVRFGRIPQM